MFGYSRTVSRLNDDQADQHDDEAQHRREDRPADAELGKRHRQEAFGATVRTAEPSRSLTAPSVTMTRVARQALDDLDLAARGAARS